ncbi:NAD(P)-dependent alcohol dehydrogenase [Sorangium sp. So ce302]|uniref:NAD(P)-dependent alcohol dehydrogenase n=1 Tax=Sorangium sp. So ce302 TaxID=3133297 RepID=UPI003F649128
MQLAKHFGAEVTGVCSTANLGLVKSLGADTDIDYTKEDFAKGGEDYDILFDAVGKTSFSRCKGSLKEGGVLLSTQVALPILFQSVWTSIVGGKRAVCATSIEKNEALVLMRELIEAGKLKPVIDRCYPLEQIAEAHRCVDTGRKRGSVAITVASEDRA